MRRSGVGPRRCLWTGMRTSSSGEDSRASSLSLSSISSALAYMANANSSSRTSLSHCAVCKLHAQRLTGNSSIKVIAITGLIILGIVLDLGGGPNHDRIGFRYWKNPGPFVQYKEIAGTTGRFLGWWAVMTQAAFSYIGTEIVAIAAGEAKNPRRNIPRAIVSTK